MDAVCVHSNDDFVMTGRKEIKNVKSTSGS